ncbi:MAG: WYL domain-containing protein [Planctomyces sp.]|nr:WYL domain-containing protein [Planctomyces sp.]
MAAVDKIRRILNLVERLQSGRVYNARQLAEFQGVSHRTMFRDITLLKQSGVPVYYDEQRRGYFMSAAAFLPPTDLTLQEALALLILTQELGKPDAGIPFQQAAHSAALKFLSNINGQLRTHLGLITSATHVRLHARHPLDGAQSHYERLQQAISERRRIRLRYNSLHDRSEITTLLSPYGLLFSRRTWYVLGRSSLHRSIRTFHLGRIRESALTGDRYEIPPRFSVSGHLGLAWHLIREPRGRTKVVIRFQPLVAANVAEVSWHRTQRIVPREDGSIEFHATVDGIREIAWWVLGYGDQAEVLEPPELRDLITQRIRAMAATYGLVPAARKARRPRQG